MPVIAIKLNNQAKRRNKGIHAELLSYEMLLVIRYLQRIKGRVARYLKFGPLHGLLSEVHSHQHRAFFGIGIPASDRAVLDAVLTAGGQGRGFPKRLLANLADVRRFAPSLPLIDARNAAKMKLMAFYEAAGLVCNSLTLMTRNIFAGLSCWTARRSVARKRAIF